MIKLKCIIIEDSYLIKKGLESLLNEFKEIDIIRSFQEIQGALSYIENSKIDIAFINQSILNNFSRQRLQLIIADKSIKIIELIENNSKRKSDKEVISLHGNKNQLLHKIEYLIENSERKKETKKENIISKREETILQNIALGLTNKEIAEKLFLSAHTVVTHRKNLTKKLGIKTVSGLTIYAIINNIISMDDIN